MVVLYKDPITPNPYYSNTSYTVNNVTYSGYAYNFYNANITTSINNTSSNELFAWYGNESTFNSANITSLEFNKFLESGPPSVPRSLVVSNPTSTTLYVSYIVPEFADVLNPGQGTITSYNVQYSSPGSEIRYPSGIAFSTSTVTVSGTNTTLTSLYPDSTFSIQVAATNNSNITGPYTSPTSGITTNINPLASLTSITFNYGTYNNPNTSVIYYITNTSTTNSITRSLLANSSLTVTSLTMPIHQISNRGKLQTSGTLMTFSTNLNGNNSLSINFQGFGGTIPSNVSNLVIAMSNPSIVDNYNSSSSFNQGFYLNAVINMTIQNSGFTVQNTQNTVNFSQSFNTIPSTQSSGSFSFYYDTPISTAPTASLSSFGISSSFFRTISGINVLFSTPQITINTTANNMGNFFYSSPPLSYTCTVNSSTVASYNETNLANVNRSSYYPNNSLASSIVFNSTIPVTTSLATTYATQLVLSVIANNVHSTSSSVSTTQNVIIDGLSNTLVYTTLSQTIATASSSALAGYRVWSAPSVSNNCPYLTKDNSGTTYYRNIPYSNTWNITTTNGGYDATTELLVSNGLFCTPPRGGYINYSTYLNNTFNYSTISSTGFRFATFCWKLAPRSNSYSTLSFTINSISPTPTLNGAGLLQINSRQIQVLYFFQDESQSSTFSSTVFNSIWIDGNNNNNGVTSSTFYDTSKPYGYYGGIDASRGVQISSSNATINVFVPSVNPVNNTTYLYLRLVIPMDISIGFGNVTATIN